MVLRATAEVETLRENPYDYLVAPVNQRLPISYQPWETALLAPAVRRSAVPIHVDPARELAEQMREASRGEVVPFLARLTETIAHRFKVVHREQGSPWPPATTIEQRQGACRDLAVLWIDICRSVGLAARFVSGYLDGDAEQDKRFLHAWAEVYLPGAGWRGYDPTNGLAVADRHIAIAASADPQQAAPVTATYRGSNVEAELYADVTVETNSAVAVAAC
jgi:transglutaminase-like putative cysteine protease